MDSIKYFDMFGKGFTPTVNFQKQPRTVFGGVFGILYILFNILLLYQYGRVLLLKDTPAVLLTVDVNSDTKLNLTLALGTKVIIRQKNYFQDRNKSIWEKDMSYLQQNLNRVLTIKYSYTSLQGKIEIPTKECNGSDFMSNYSNASIYDLIYIDKATCMDYSKLNMTLTKRFGDPRVEAIEISYYKCANVSLNDNCLPQSDLDYFFKYFDFRVYFSFPGLQFTPSNYYDPLDTYGDYFYSKIIAINEIIPVTYYLEISNVYISTDTGNILIDFSDQKQQKIDSLSYCVGGPEYESNSVDGKYRQKLNEFVIYASKNTYTFERNYPKIHEVIANIMGVTTIASVVVEHLIGKIYNSRTREIITHQIFNIEEATIMRELAKEKNAMCDAAVEMPISNQDQSPNESNIHLKGNAVDSPTQPNYLNQSKSTDQRIKLDLPKKNKNNLNHQFRFKLNNNKTDIQMISKRSIYEMKQKGLLLDGISKTNFSLKSDDKLLLTLWDHFILVYFRCCVCGRVKKISKYYNSIHKYVSEFTDILTLCNNLIEIEKLKYLLFDEDQCTLFNYRTKIEVGKSETEQSDFTKYFYFIKDLNDNIDVNEICREVSKRESQQMLNQKLATLVV